jgi:4-hydroxybenzoate polyprenyltransferase
MTEQRPNYQVVLGPKGPQVVDINRATPATERPSMLKSIIQLMRLDRPVGILLLLWPTLTALWLAARGIPESLILFIFIAGVVLTRSAGCVINDYADRWLDGHVERTKNRPLASGEISGSVALALFTGLMLMAFLLELLTNRNTVYLSVVALLIATIYPYCKRYTYYPQMVLGIAFSMGIPMAFTALDKTPDAVAWLLFCGNCLWTLAYDTLYAMVDREDDLKVGAKSTAILFGELDIFAVAILHAFALLAFVLMGLRAELHWPFFAALAIVLLLMSWQIRLAMTRSTAAYFQAFRANQWLGLALFAGVWAGL